MTTADELTRRLSPSGLAYLSGALSFTLDSGRAFTLDDLRRVVERMQADSGRYFLQEAL